jgi:hypothetical protein
MTDYVITGGRSSAYPAVHYGAHFTGTRATFCEPADFAGLDANVLAIPNLNITVLSASPVTVPQEFFGTHVYYRANDSSLQTTYRTIRIHDMQGGKARWQFIQPADDPDTDNWDWTDLDLLVNTHHAAGRDLIFQLFGTPAWASARPTERNAYSDQPGSGIEFNRGIGAEPADMADWDAFCTAVATRYAGKIRYYEVWNEVNYQNNGTAATGTAAYFTGSYAKLAEMVRRANQAIKAADPTAKIICPNTQGWTTTSGATDTYFTGMMSASTGDGSTTMKDWVDIIGVHLYLPTSNKVQDLAGMIDRINASKTTAGVSALPTWDTESSMISSQASAYSDAKVCRHIGRFMLTAAAKGIERSNWYQWDRDELDGYGFKNRPVVVAFHEAMRALLMSGTILTVSRFADGRVGYYTSHGLTVI